MKMKKIYLLLAFLLGVSSNVISNTIAVDSALVRDADDSIRVSLVTCSPGTEVYAVYGHSALRVEIPAQGVDMAVNYGLFAFDAPHFVWRFIRGETDYVCGAINYPIFEREYIERGSSVTLQQLNLSQEEKVRLVQLLNHNLSPQHRTYRYNFLYNNCSTKARDKVEEAVTTARFAVDMPDSAAISYRTILHEYTDPYPWLQYGIDYLLGVEADYPIDGRQQDFAPEYLMQHVASTTLTVDSMCYPYVLTQEVVAPIAPADAVWRFPLTPVQAMVLLLLLVAIMCTLEFLVERRLWWFDVLLFTLQGLMGCVVAFLFFFSGHPTVGSNLHVIYLNPLPLFFVPFVVHSALKHRLSLLYYVMAFLLVAFLVISLIFDQYIQPAAYLFVAALLLRVLHNLWIYPYLKHRLGELYASKSKPRASRVRMVLALIACMSTPATHAGEVPKIVVNIVVDQLRADYLEKYSHLYGSDGFKKIFAQGCTYMNGYFDYVSPDRSSSVASICTGTTPYYHGITGNRFLERKSLRVLSSVDDARYKGVNTDESTSPANLLVTTLADELKMATQGHALVYSIAPERDMAVLAGGHAPDVVLWLSNDKGLWASSGYYAGMPSWLRPYNHREGGPFDWASITWEPYHANFVYSSPTYEGKLRAFHHTFRKGDAETVKRYKTSACVNDEVTQLAITCIDKANLGDRKTTDMLCVGYYAGNYEHASEWGRPMELQDIYCRLDRNIAELIRVVDEQVGIDNALFVITSTGYTDIHRPDSKLLTLPTGELYTDRYQALLNMYLSALYGQGDYVEGGYLNEIYLNQSLISKRQIGLRNLQDCSVEFLSQIKGVKRVYASLSLLSGTADADVRSRFNSERSGDLLLEVSPGWLLVDERWGERLYYNRSRVPVPILLYGLDLSPKASHAPTSVLGVAPTLAHILRVGVPNGCSETPFNLVFR